MGRLIVTEYVSLDGVIEAPGGGEDFAHGGWSFAVERGPELEELKYRETFDAEAMLLGRVTYELFAASWPSIPGEFADRFNAMPKFVVSSTLERADWGDTRIITGDLAAEVAGLKREVAGDIVVHGSARLVQGLLAAEVVDELRLVVFPVVLGSGLRLFGPADDVTMFRLEEARTVGEGILIAVYAPSYDFTVERRMAAPLAEVWRAWTEPDEYAAWFSAVPGTTELDVRPGGSWRLELAGSDGGPPEVLEGTYIDVVAEQELVMSTTFAGGATVMDIRFVAVDDGATLVEISQRCRSTDERDGARQGSLMLLQWCADHVEDDAPGG